MNCIRRCVLRESRLIRSVSVFTVMFAPCSLNPGQNMLFCSQQFNHSFDISHMSHGNLCVRCSSQSLVIKL